jgi:hypothetical protein
MLLFAWLFAGVAGFCMMKVCHKVVYPVEEVKRITPPSEKEKKMCSSWCGDDNADDETPPMVEVKCSFSAEIYTRGCIGSNANGIPLGCSLLLPVGTVKH